MDIPSYTNNDTSFKTSNVSCKYAGANSLESLLHSVHRDLETSLLYRVIDVYNMIIEAVSHLQACTNIT